MEKQTRQDSLEKAANTLPGKGWCRDMPGTQCPILIMHRLCKQWLTRSIWKDFPRCNFYSCPFNVVVSIGEKGDKGYAIWARALEFYKMELRVFSLVLV